MADAQSNIQVNIDTTQALASIKNLQRQIAAFHTSMAKGGAAANAVSAQMQQTLINSINATGKFSAQIRTIKTTTESFTSSLEKNKFSLGEYFRYAGGASKTFGRLFKTEFDTINKVARENVKDLQTQYIRMGRDASGAMKAIAVRPLSLDMSDLATRTQIAAQKQAILNQLLKQGSTNLLNFGKNTQWAGRQLMVGFTLPLIALGSAASKTFMDMETQAIRFKKVYGDLFTPTAESQQALKDIQELGKEFTKYGIAVADTVGLAAEAAAAGFKGVDLQRQTAAATKLSILGQVEGQKALETTISLQNAFSMSSENLAESIDFLNAVENQTVLSLDDMSTAIPKAAPVVQQLGGDVKDLAFLMTAMKEGGINASEGANALKSGLASLINPTGKANDMLLAFGINAKKIVLDNKGDLKKTVVEFATALNMLDPLNRAQAIEQMFGKFQFARLSTLFANVTKEGTQASRVLDLAGASVQELAALSEKELGMTSESAMNKFKGAVENLKLALVPLGEQFLKAVTPIAEFITKILDKFNNLSDNTKKIIVTITAVVAGLGPVFLMTFGLLANGLANIIKGFTFLKTLFNKTGQSTAMLGTEVQYMTTEQRNAAAVAASLDQVHVKLAQTFTSEAAAVNALTQAYQRAIAAQSQFVPVGPPLTRGPIKKFAGGRPATVGGTGNKDSELALLMPGETVIPTAMSAKYGGLINAMIADKIPGYEVGKPKAGEIPIYPEYAMRLQDASENMGQRSGATGVPNVLSPLALRIGEARGISPTQRQIDSGAFDSIYDEYKDITTQFVDRVNLEYNETFKDIKDENERMQKAWSAAGKHVEKQVDSIESVKDRSVVRKVFALDEDEYGTIPTDSREKGGTAPNRARRGAFRSRMTGFRSYTDIRAGAKRLFSRKTETPAESLQMGHVFGPRTVPIETLEADPRKTASVASARKVLDRGKKDGAEYAKGVDSVVKDPYELSQDRSSPHRRAAPDGKADGTAYVEARDKAITQAGRKRRVATRGQGPAPIGATPQPGMRVLPIVPPDPEGPKPPSSTAATQTRGQVLADRARNIGGRMTGMGGGMGLLGVNMGLSMLPDFAGKGVMQGGLAGANLGMMFGGYGMAAGAAIGVVTSAVSALIATYKELEDVTAATFKSSAELATFFGNTAADTTLKVGRFSASITNLKVASDGVQQSFGYTNEELTQFIALIDSLPEENPLREIIDALAKEDNAAKINKLAKEFITTQVALGNIKPDQAQKTLDLMLAASDNLSMVGLSFITLQSQTEAVSATLNNAAGSAKALGDTLLQLLGIASNSTSLETIKTILEGIGAAGLNTAAALDAMGLALRRAGASSEYIKAFNILSSVPGIDEAQVVEILTAASQGFSVDTTGKTPEQLIKEAKKFLDEVDLGKPSNVISNIQTNAYKEIEKETAESKLQIKILKQKKKIVDDQIKQQEKISSEIKRQNDYLDKQRDLDKQIVDAKIRGNYIEAASLLQQKAENTSEFNQETEKSKLQAKSDALQEQIDALQLKNDEMVDAINKSASDQVAATNNSTSKIVEAIKFGKIVGPADDFANKSTKAGESFGADRKRVEAETLREAARIAITGRQTQQYVPATGGPGFYLFQWEGKTYASDKMTGVIYNFDTEKNKVGERAKYASGGAVRGAGTRTSDSIPAYLSNGEYVIKANSVKKYGVGTFDALNAGRFANGGLVPGYKDGGLFGGLKNKFNSYFNQFGKNKESVDKASGTRKYTEGIIRGLMANLGPAGYIKSFDKLGILNPITQKASTMYQDFAYGAVGKPIEEILAGSGTKGDFAWTALNLLPGGGSAAKTGAQAAAKAPSMAGAAVRAGKAIPGAAGDLLKSGLWSTLGKAKPLQNFLYKMIGFKPIGLKGSFKGAFDYASKGKSYFNDIVNRPPAPPRAGSGASPIPDAWSSISPILRPMEAFGDLAGLMKNKFIDPVMKPIKGGIGKIKDMSSLFSKEKMSQTLLKLSPKAISNFLYRYTPIGSIQAAKLANEQGFIKTISDMPGGVDLPLEELFKQAFYHGGALPEQLLNRLVPGEVGAGTGSIFNFDLFTTMDKLLARQYAVAKNAEAGGSLWEILFNMPKNMSKVWDMRGGMPSLWSQNKEAYVALEKYLIDVLKMPVKEARAMLAGERVSGTARVSQNTGDRASPFIHRSLNEMFSVMGKKGPEWLIDTIVHTGGKLTGSNVMHPVIATLDPEKNVKSLKNILPQADLKKTFGMLEEFLPSALERYIEQYAKSGKTFSTLLEGIWPIMHKSTSAATGGYLNKGKLRVPKFANGGLIRGAGTGTSDSIRASLGYAGGGSIRVSNGEYVVKASSVRDYGVKTMDAINNGTAAVGANSGGTVYNINMPITSNNADAEGVANEVMRKLKLEVSKNNKTNRVGL